MALGGVQHPVGNQTALKSVYACRCTRLGRVTSTGRLCVRVAGNANRRAGCVTSAPLLAQRGGWEHCPGPDGLRNLRPRLCGGGWEHCLPGGLRNPSPWCFGVREGGTLPGNHTSMLAAARQMGCVTSYPACAGVAGNTICPVGCVTPPPGASASGKGEHCRGKTIRVSLPLAVRRMGCVTSNPACAGAEGTPSPLVGCVTSLPVLAHGGGGTLPG